MFHEQEYGAAVVVQIVDQVLAPAARTWTSTEAMPERSSAAVAVTVTVPRTVAPGEAIETVGGVQSKAPETELVLDEDETKVAEENPVTLAMPAPAMRARASRIRVRFIGLLLVSRRWFMVMSAPSTGRQVAGGRSS